MDQENSTQGDLVSSASHLLRWPKRNARNFADFGKANRDYLNDEELFIRAGKHPSAPKQAVEEWLSGHLLGTSPRKNPPF